MKSRYRKIKVNGKTYLYHRYLMAQHLGRELRADEHVHHKNEDRYDNRLENLEVKPAAMHIAEHKTKHPKTKLCVVCGEFFTPAPTKRKRAETCSKGCGYQLRWARRRGVAA